MKENRQINWIFGAAVAFLTLVAASSMITNQGRPVILEPEASNVPSNSALPENHPPLDALNRVSTLLQMSRNDPQNPSLKIQLANAYYDAGLYKEAIRAYEEGTALKPQGPEVETDLATCYHYLGQDDKALEVLNQVLQRQPTFAPALFNKGIVLEEGKNDVRGAIVAWEELLRANPNHPQRSQLEQRISRLKSARK